MALRLQAWPGTLQRDYRTVCHASLVHEPWDNTEVWLTVCCPLNREASNSTLAGCSGGQGPQIIVTCNFSAICDTFG